MHRTQLLELLSDYSPQDKDELLAKSKMIEFARAHSDCFERSLSVGHFTASAWLLNKDRSKALLMHHAKINRWVQLGGHADGESDLLAVALKEAREESGILNIIPVSKEIFDIDIHEFPAKGKDPAHLHYDVRFLLRVCTDEEGVHNSESHGLKWIFRKKEDLPTEARSVTRMFEKWLQIRID